MRYNSITIHLGTWTKLSESHWDITQTRKANLWHTDFLGMQHSLPSHFFISFGRAATPYCEEYVYIHISDCVDIVRKLPLLPSSTANETFLHKLGVERNVDWIYIIGAAHWQSVGEFVTLDKMFDNVLFKQEIEATPFTSKFSSLTHSPRMSLLEIK